jgi:hypothetical protein
MNRGTEYAWSKHIDLRFLDMAKWSPYSITQHDQVMLKLETQLLEKITT